MIFIALLIFWLMVLCAWVFFLAGNGVTLVFSVLGMLFSTYLIWDEVTQYMRDDKLFK